MPQIRGWRGRVGGLTMLSDTGDQVVCTVDQTDGHTIPQVEQMSSGTVWDHRLPY